MFDYESVSGGSEGPAFEYKSITDGSLESLLFQCELESEEGWELVSVMHVAVAAEAESVISARRYDVEGKYQAVMKRRKQ